MRIPPSGRTTAAGACLVVLAALATAVQPAQAAAIQCTTQPTCTTRAVSYRAVDGTKVAASVPRVLRREKVAAFPSAFVNRGTVWIGYSRGEDLIGAAPQYGLLVSRNGGRTFATHSARPALENAVVKANGEQIAISGQTRIDPGSRTATVPMWRGPNWTRGTAKLHLARAVVSGAGANFSNGIIRFGVTLLAPYYTRYGTDPKAPKANRVEIAASTDGVTWRTRGTVVRPYTLPNGNVVTYSESSIVRLGSGALMVIARSEEFTKAGDRVRLRPMVYSISTNGGVTWRTPRPVLIGGQALAFGARPTVLRMGNGRYVLATGRPDNVLAFAKRTFQDGSPVWTGQLLAYRNYPQTPLHGRVFRWGGSSGYMALAPVSPTTLLAIFDNCAATWGCRSYHRGFTVSREHRLVSRWVRVT